MSIKFLPAAKGAAAQTSNIVQETVNRLASLPDTAAFLVGMRPYKRLRLRVVVLRDENGVPLAAEAEVMPSIHEMERVFRQAARVHILPAEPIIFTVPEPTPTYALDVHCDDGAWQEDFTDCGAYFRQAMAKHFPGTLLGYAAPVTVMIVRDISNKGGCSLGPLADYVTLEAKMLNRAKFRILAHEVGHACGLFHSKVKANLMWPKGPGDQLVWWQTAVLRNSRHVTYL